MDAPTLSLEVTLDTGIGFTATFNQPSGATKVVLEIDLNDTGWAAAGDFTGTTAYFTGYYWQNYVKVRAMATDGAGDDSTWTESGYLNLELYTAVPTDPLSFVVTETDPIRIEVI